MFSLVTNAMKTKLQSFPQNIRLQIATIAAHAQSYQSQANDPIVRLALQKVAVLMRQADLLRGDAVTANKLVKEAYEVVNTYNFARAVQKYETAEFGDKLVRFLVSFIRYQSALQKLAETSPLGVILVFV